ncbi:MAG: DNA polymerase/3'-5' exonuclease PolX, partial [Gemmatimonadaceae bacterium]
EIAGALRRKLELVERIDLVVECATDPVAVGQSLGRLAGVRAASGRGARVAIEFVDGVRAAVECASTDDFGAALWRATGSDEHVAAVIARLIERGVIPDDDDPRIQPGLDEPAIYRAAGLSFIEPELREDRGEIEAAARGALPLLIAAADIRGVLHCHTHYSDGRAAVAEMAEGARVRGWSYIGITDHSQAAFYVGGMTRDKILAQHEEIDELNARSSDVRILKGVEADILADGRVDYDDETLAMFDFVVGSVHSQFAMGEAAMTERVLRALDNPRLTILGHPTGRILLARDAYAIDVNAVIDKAAAVGVAIELNADPRRADLDWRHLRRAAALGVTIEIGPDAHSVNALDNVGLGVGLARKAWVTQAGVLNARSADDVLSFARRRLSR